jgi:hypothetical protein
VDGWHPGGYWGGGHWSRSGRISHEQSSSQMISMGMDAMEEARDGGETCDGGRFPHMQRSRAGGSAGWPLSFFFFFFEMLVCIGGYPTTLTNYNGCV